MRVEPHPRAGELRHGGDHGGGQGNDEQGQGQHGQVCLQGMPNSDCLVSPQLKAVSLGGFSGVLMLRVAVGGE